jgi:hypothetical protein
MYRYDAASHDLSADWIEAATDEEAIARIAERGFGSKCEIWEGERLVAQLDGERRQA